MDGFYFRQAHINFDIFNVDTFFQRTFYFVGVVQLKFGFQIGHLFKIPRSFNVSVHTAGTSSTLIPFSSHEIQKGFFLVCLINIKNTHTVLFASTVNQFVTQALYVWNNDFIDVPLFLHHSSDFRYGICPNLLGNFNSDDICL